MVHKICHTNPQVQVKRDLQPEAQRPAWGSRLSRWQLIRDFVVLMEVRSPRVADRLPTGLATRASRQKSVLVEVRAPGGWARGDPADETGHWPGGEAGHLPVGEPLQVFKQVIAAGHV